MGDTIDRQTDRLRAIGRVCCRVLALCWETRAVTHVGLAYVTAMQESGCVVGIGSCIVSVIGSEHVIEDCM